jgi:hypothetical protein
MEPVTSTFVAELEQRVRRAEEPIDARAHMLMVDSVAMSLDSTDEPPPIMIEVDWMLV